MALVLTTVAACGVEVPAGLADKVKSGCPDLVKPEPVAVIAQGLEVSEVVSERAESCTVSVRDGRVVLDIGLIGYPSQDIADQQAAVECHSREWDASDKSCSVTSPGGGRFIVRGVAGRWVARVAVYEVTINDDVKDAAYQILEDLRSSGKTK
ncbi:hypothetical protein LFM09_44985 [Lentzea alba]|uniref:hypothetical protein n=1 Tax=Lentzea alba TaxID=2714351 RepID=UPI0039BED2CB